MVSCFLLKRAHLVIRGRVQGVFYRASTRARAEELGLVGWVRNLASGEVEVVAEGGKAPLEELLAWCWNGPDMAVVDDIDVTWQDATGEFSRFLVTR